MKSPYKSEFPDAVPRLSLQLIKLRRKFSVIYLLGNEWQFVISTQESVNAAAAQTMSPTTITPLLLCHTNCRVLRTGAYCLPFMWSLQFRPYFAYDTHQLKTKHSINIYIKGLTEFLKIDKEFEIVWNFNTYESLLECTLLYSLFGIKQIPISYLK